MYYFFDLSGESNTGRECSYAAGKNFAHAMKQMDGVNHVDVVDESVISFDFGCDPKKRRMRMGGDAAENSERRFEGHIRAMTW